MHSMQGLRTNVWTNPGSSELTATSSREKQKEPEDKQRELYSFDRDTGGIAVLLVAQQGMPRIWGC